MLRALLKAKTKKVSFLAGLVVALAAVFGSAGLAVHKVSAADCDSNAIIYCGMSSPSDFINTVRRNDSKNGHNDLQAIYAHYHLTASDYSNFAAHAESGTAYKDGRIVVNGQTVVTGSKSIGREASFQGSGYFKTVIGNTAYYGNTNDKAFVPNSLPVYVLFNSDGNEQFAVLKSCGNPIYGERVATSASCNSLQKTAVAGQDNTYDFSASMHTAGNAAPEKFVYTFGDGSPAKIVTSNFGQTVRHTYTSPGTFQARVTEFASVPGDSSKELPVISTCIKQVVVPKPSYSCVTLVGAILDKSNNTYKFTVTGKYGPNVTPVSADFNFGDKTSKSVKLSGTTVSTTHAYKVASTYVASAVLHFKAFGNAASATSAGCRVPIPVTVPYCQGLTGAIIDKSKYLAQFTATAHVVEGTKLASADFTFGDGKSQKGVKFTTATTVVVTHTYAKGGTYDAAATLHFVTTSGNKTITAPVCKALVKPKTIVSECKPGIPVGDERCSPPCATNPSVPADDTENCVVAPPPELPNTGAGDTIAIFAAVVVGGFLVYRQLLFRRHKAAFVAAQQGTSPLPLGDPLSEDAPLAGTPLAPKRRSFRKRQF